MSIPSSTVSGAPGGAFSIKGTTLLPASIRVVFSSEVDASSVLPASVQVRGPQGNSIAATTSALGATVSLLLSARRLPGGTTYSFNLAAGIRSATGVALGESYAVNFTTPDQLWLNAPVEIDDTSLRDAFSPSMAVGPDGAVTAAWAQNNGLRNAVFASRYRGGAWSAPVQVDDASLPGDVDFPLVAADAAGNIMAVWGQFDVGLNRIVLYASRYGVAASAWSAPVQLDSPVVPGDVSERRVGMDRAGNGVAVWTQNDGVRLVLYASRYSGGTWSTAQQIDSLASVDGSFYVNLALDDSGNITVVWTQGTFPNFSINASRYNIASSVWSAPVRLDTAAGNVGSCTATVDQQGNATVTWVENSSGRNANYAVRLSIGSNSWSSPVQINSLGVASINESSAVLAADELGNVTAAWRENDGGPNVLKAARFSLASGTWGAAVAVSDPALAIGFGVGEYRIAVDIAGNVMAAWSEDDGTHRRLFARRYGATDGTWGAQLNLDDAANGNDVQELNLIADLQGNMTVAWSQVFGTHSAILVSRFQ